MKPGLLQIDHQVKKRSVGRKFKDKWREVDMAEAAAYREAMLTRAAELWRTERIIREALRAAAVIVPIVVFAIVFGYMMGLF